MAKLSNEQIGKNVMILRESAGVSMDKLAEAMRARGHKWTRVTVFNIEHGERMLKVQEAFDLLDSLGMDQKYGMRVITSESDVRRDIRNAITNIHNGLEGLRDAIAAIQSSRADLQLHLRGPYDSGTDEQNKWAALGTHLKQESVEVCKEMDVEDLLKYTSPEEIVRAVKDLLSVPPLKWNGEEGESIQLMSGSDEAPMELIVADAWTGQPYRATDSDENIIKD